MTTDERKRVGLKEVADAAGVSIVTVSRAMNFPERVSKKTRDRIDAAIRAIDYVPDLTARSMAKQRTRIVAAFVPSLVDPIFVSTIEGLDEVFAPAGLHLLLGHTQYDVDKEEALVAAALGRRPDALVLIGTTHTDRLRRLIGGSGIPVVEAWGLAGEAIDHLVGFDHEAAGYALTGHLIERGRRRIGFVGRPAADNERAAGKQRGYRRAMADAGLAVPDMVVIEAETVPSLGAAAIERLVPRHVDAIVFTGDNTATGAFLHCLSCGIDVPGDVAICGFGDHETGRLLPGGLTTVRVDATAIGRTAATVLVDALAGRATDRVTDVGYELVVRGSS